MTAFWVRLKFSGEPENQFFFLGKKSTYASLPFDGSDTISSLGEDVPTNSSTIMYNVHVALDLQVYVHRASRQQKLCRLTLASRVNIRAWDNTPRASPNAAGIAVNGARFS